MKTQSILFLIYSFKFSAKKLEFIKVTFFLDLYTLQLFFA